MKTGRITPKGVVHALRYDKRNFVQTECGWITTCIHVPVVRGGKVSCKLCKEYLKMKKKKGW